MSKSMKNLVVLLTGLVFIFSGNLKKVEASEYAHPTKSKVLVDEKVVDFEAYTINGHNYFKLRDIAKVLSGSKATFNVKWDANKNAINLITGEAYEVVGGEMEKSNIVTVKLTKNNAPIYKNGEKISMLAYNIGGNNYFKLRDIGKEIGFGVAYDEGKQTVLIDTSTSTLSDIPKTEKDKPSTSQIIEDLDEYKLKIEYRNGDDIEYKYDLDRDGSIDAEIDDEVNNTKVKGPKAAEFIEEKLLKLDYSGSYDEVVNRIFNSLGISKDYKKLKLEIEYNNKAKLEIEIKK